jgi:membrane dipeptidase
LALALVLSLVLLAACGPGDSGGETTAVDDRASELARRLMIVDTHVDAPYQQTETPRDLGVRNAETDFDYPRAREGGLDLPFMSIYIPASYQEKGGAKALADELIDGVEAMAAEHPDKFTIVHDVDQARRAFVDGKIGLALGMENGAGIEGDLANLAHFQARGIRYVTLAHSKSNAICDSSYDEERRWEGLSPFGRDVVAEMNRLGIMIDVSHVTDETFFQVMELTQAPVIASHSSCRHFTPGWERNMSDEMILALGENGGVIQINFGSSFINDDYRQARQAHWKAVGSYLDEHGIDKDSDEARKYQRDYFTANPVPVADIREVAAHIDHVVGLVGIDHVGLGSDFDGVGDSLPTGLEDVAAFPNLIRELLELGYSEEEIEKVCSGNLLRVWSEVERVARES